MKTIERLIVDLPSILKTCLFVGVDSENGFTVEHEGKQVNVNSAQYGYENAINAIVKAWEGTKIKPKNTILVRETGFTTATRQNILPQYKAKRNEDKAPEYKAEYAMQQEMVIDALRKVGVTVVTRPAVEADDVIAYLTAHLDGNLVIMTRDGDMAALINERVSVWGKDGLITENPLGPWDTKYIPLYKALVGDTSDKIPGAKGFGPKSFLDLYCIFGDEGMDAMVDLIQRKSLKSLEEDVPDLKALSKIIAAEKDVYASYAVGKLMPELCENFRVPLEWLPSFVAPRNQIEDERLRPYGGIIRLVTQENYDEAFNFAKSKIIQSEYVALDIETSMCQEAIDWLKDIKDTDDEDKIGVDVLGSELNGLSLTFGPNDNYTIYMTNGHVETETETNLTSDQILAMVKLVPPKCPLIVHNSSFELPILYLEWKDKWSDNGWHGFLPNVHDTMVLTTYVNENIGRGLKFLSKEYFGYEQVSYQEVTGGLRMNQMTARDVLAYGADDTIMTAALYKHFKMICELEGSWKAFAEKEIKPAYVTALAYTTGINFSLQKMLELEREDRAAMENHQRIIDDFLINLGWDGTICPVYTEEDLDDYKKLKEMFFFFTSVEIKTQVRTANKIVKLIDSGVELALEATVNQDEFDSDCKLFVRFAEDRNIAQINDMIAKRFDGKPKFDLSSPKQMGNLLYNVLETPVRIVNKMTELQRKNNPDLADAVYKFNKILRGSDSVEPLTPEEQVLLRQKASTDDTAIQYALQEELPEKTKEFLNALLELKTLITRCNLFYNKYRSLKHWKTGNIHPNLNQCGAPATKRYSASGPNIQQVPKRGEGVKFRGTFIPHKKKAVVVAMDMAQQELRIQAELSQDPAMLACFVGDNPKDMHSMTAAEAMILRWGEAYVSDLSEKYGIPYNTEEGRYQLFYHVLKNGDEDESKKADDLRKVCKAVNFGSAYGTSGPTLAKQLLTDVPVAENMLTAKKSAFNVYESWKEKAESDVLKTGYTLLRDGSRRHLGHAVSSDNSWERDRAARQASNYLVQGLGIVQLKEVLTMLWDSDLLFKYDVRFYAPIHDEVVFSVDIDHAVDFITEMHKIMVHDFYETVPVRSSISIGPDFAAQKDLGEVVDVELINNHINKLFAVAA